MVVVARTIGRAILWLLLGFTGSLVILVVTTRIIDTQGYPRLQSGGLVFVDYWDRGYVQASGTWVFEGDTKQAFPRQTTEIKCYRDEKQCRAAQAEIAFDMLTVQTEIFPITSWDSQSIVYVSNDPLCVTYTYTISRSTSRVTGLRQTKPSPPAGSCEAFEKRTLALFTKRGI